MRELTKAEEQVMHLLWELKRAFVKDVIEKMPEPKPAYNTVSTIIRILEQKGFVEHQAYGKTHEYYPIISKNEYRSFYLKSVVGGYFGGSLKNLVSFFAKDNDMDVKDVEELMKYVKDDLEKDKDQNNG